MGPKSWGFQGIPYESRPTYMYVYMNTYESCLFYRIYMYSYYTYLYLFVVMCIYMYLYDFMFYMILWFISCHCVWIRWTRSRWAIVQALQSHFPEAFQIHLEIVRTETTPTYILYYECVCCPSWFDKMVVGMIETILFSKSLTTISKVVILEFWMISDYD